MDSAFDSVLRLDHTLYDDNDNNTSRHEAATKAVLEMAIFSSQVAYKLASTTGYAREEAYARATDAFKTRVNSTCDALLQAMGGKGEDCRDGDDGERAMDAKEGAQEFIGLQANIMEDHITGIEQKLDLEDRVEGLFDSHRSRASETPVLAPNAIASGHPFNNTFPKFKRSPEPSSGPLGGVPACQSVIREYRAPQPDGTYKILKRRGPAPAEGSRRRAYVQGVGADT
ncbi:hypothetical protein K466DRAFT_606555 [Polyporus arcularius HHB13444]|uniref:Uncharacterized protein n=1 Tax=Polyporus arcularius HHB13444 TaxID=1314778 RepID=A0A5C3NN36_9APHY|nr:hypothetical protein K466DRAFT_606555 [Polyporus arcularius HHB13444]